MIDIIVQRGSGARPGADIVDPLIASVPVAIQRGRNELDERASGMREVSVEVVYRTGVRAGQLARFYDAQLGQIWTGKIAGISHSVSNVNGSLQTITTLKVKRPTVSA